MHVLHASCYLDPRGRAPEELLGAWPIVADTARAVRAAGLAVTVLQAADADAVLERDDVAFHFVRVARRHGPAAAARRGAAAARAVARHATRLRPDVVHLHGLGFPLAARRLARSTRAPVIAQDHADSPPPGARRVLHRLWLRSLAGAAFTTREHARPFLEARVLRPRTSVFEVLEASTWFAPGDRGAARQATGLRGEPGVLWVGRLDANKDIFTALEAVRRAAYARPGLHFWCCYGEPSPLEDAVRRRVAADPVLAERVHLLGNVPHDRVQLLFHAADVFLTASRRESSGFALLEAFASGTPAIATDIPSFRRITRGGRCGVLFPRGDAAAAGAALVALSADAAATRSYSERRAAVRRHFDAHLSWRVVGEELHSAYATLARNGVAPHQPAPAPTRPSEEPGPAAPVRTPPTGGHA